MLSKFCFLGRSRLFRRGRPDRLFLLHPAGPGLQLATSKQNQAPTIAMGKAIEANIPASRPTHVPDKAQILGCVHNEVYVASISSLFTASGSRWRQRESRSFYTACTFRSSDLKSKKLENSELQSWHQNSHISKRFPNQTLMFWGGSAVLPSIDLAQTETTLRAFLIRTYNNKVVSLKD